MKLPTVRRRDDAPERVRSCVESDLAAVEDLLCACGLPLEGVSGALPDYFVCEDGPTLLGVAGLEILGEDALLRSVAVRSASRRRGVAANLIAACEAHAMRRGCVRLYLLTLDAAGYFARLGFEAVPRTHAPEAISATAEFSRLCPGSAVLMRRVLGSARR